MSGQGTQVNFAAALTAMQAGSGVARAAWTDGSVLTLFPGGQGSDPTFKVTRGDMTLACQIAAKDLLASDWVVQTAPAP